MFRNTMLNHKKIIISVAITYYLHQFQSTAFLLITIVLLLTINGCEKNPDPEPELPFGWQPNIRGKILYSDSFWTSGNDRLYTIDSTQKKKLTHEGITNYGALWSPDGNSILYTHDEELILMTANGNEIKSVFTGNQTIQYPDWSPDGTKIAFINNSNFLTIIDTSGNTLDSVDLKKVNIYPIIEGLAWTTDGNRIAIEENTMLGKEYLHILNVSYEKKIIELTYEDIDEVSRQKNGKSLIYSHHNSEIYSIDGEGKNKTLLAVVPPEIVVYSLCMSPDEDLIALGTTNGVFVMDLKGNLLTHLVRLRAEAHCAYIDWY